VYKVACVALEKRLVVFDEPHRDGPGIDQFLRARHFQVYTVRMHDELVEALEYSAPDAAVITSPYETEQMSQLLQVCRPYRQTLLVAVWPRIVPKDALALYEAGADVVMGTSNADWLAAQIRAVLSRMAQERTAPTVLELGYLQIDLAQRRVTVSGDEVHLTPTEFEVLRALAERPGTVLTSGEVMQQVLGVDLPRDQAQDMLKVHVHRLRQKLERDLNDPRFIKSVRGQGYMYAFERRERVRESIAS
jgi:DNA-binding response OmpR family regulator